jgi:uncharacterized protein (DUF58 family)
VRRRRRSRRLAELAPEHSLRRLELKVTRRLDGLLHGEHLGLLPGPGSEQAEARVYQPGEDDVRHMDWAVTARTTVPHVRDLIADHELEVWSLVDLSPSMDFGTARMEKRDLAVAALAAVGFLTTRLGDRFGAYIMRQDEVRRWPARTGRAAMYELLQSILDAPQRTDGTDGTDGTAAGRSPGDAQPWWPWRRAGSEPGRENGHGPRPRPRREEGGRAAPGPGLAETIHGLARTQVKRGLRVIISDFIEQGEEAAAGPAWERPMRQLAARHQTLAVETVDPRELDLPDIGLVTMSDPETGEVREIALTPRLRARYAEAAAAQRTAVKEALRRCGVPHLVLHTDRDWIADIARFALQQRRVSGRSRTPKVG